MEIILAVLLGGLFGFALYYGEATNPKRLISMLALQNLSVMKIILFAIGLSSFLLSLATFVGVFDVAHLSIKTTHLGVLIGGLIFGVGFGWAGTCPGTCVASSSSGGLHKGIGVILGGLAGAFAFSLSYGFLDNLGLFSAMNLGKLTLFNISEKFPSVFSIGFGGLAILGILIMAVAILLPEVPGISKHHYADSVKRLSK